MYKVNEKYFPAIEYYLSKAPNDEVRKKLHEILYDGKCENFEVNSKIMNKDNADMEMCRRFNFASLLLISPQTFEILMKNNITLFHGSNSVALESILKNGMFSEKEMIKNEKEIKTGEYSFEARNFISFTDDIDLALDYASITPNGIKGNTSFGMLIGTSPDDLNSEDNDICYTTSVKSNIPEVGIIDKLPIENIRVIAVPEDKIDEVSKMMDESSKIDIIPVEHLIKATNMSIPYKMSYQMNTFEKRKERKANSLNDIKSNDNNTKILSNDEVRDLSKGRILSKIKEIIPALKRAINKEKEKGEDIEHE